MLYDKNQPVRLSSWNRRHSTRSPNRTTRIHLRDKSLHFSAVTFERLRLKRGREKRKSVRTVPTAFTLERPRLKASRERRKSMGDGSRGFESMAIPMPRFL